MSNGTAQFRNGAIYVTTADGDTVPFIRGLGNTWLATKPIGSSGGDNGGGNNPGPEPDPEGSITISGGGNTFTLEGVNLKYAAMIQKYAEGNQGLSRRETVIGFMTAMVESPPIAMYANSNVPESLNYPHEKVGSDADSLGLLQQRPSIPWGTVAELMNPDYNIRAFYGGPDGPNAGKGVPGLLDIANWQNLGYGVLAQRVQGSAFPDRYDEWRDGCEQLYDYINGLDSFAARAASGSGYGVMRRHSGRLELIGSDGGVVQFMPALGGLWLATTPVGVGGNPPPPDPGPDPDPDPSPGGGKFISPFVMAPAPEGQMPPAGSGDAALAEYGPRQLTGSMHEGIDFGYGGVTTGTPIIACADASVYHAGPEGNWGNSVILFHGRVRGNDLYTRHAHQSAINVSVGQQVKQRDVIGYVGNTGVSFGAHLHWETHKCQPGETPVNNNLNVSGYRTAIDPREFMRQYGE